MFIHRVLNMPETNITRKIMKEQQNMAGNNYIENAKMILEELKINIKMEEMENIWKSKWKITVSKAIIKNEQEKFDKWIKTSKKCEKLTGEAFGMKKYILEMDAQESEIILKKRLGMLEIKENFKQKDTNLMCDSCKIKNPATLPNLPCKYSSSK